MKLIELTQGLFTMIDDEDFELVSSFSWHFSSHGYAIRNHEGRKQRLHRMLLGLVLGDGIQVDHVNGDKLNNTRANLRVCTNAENMHNRGKTKKNTSGFKGVSLMKDRARKNPWRAVIQLNDKNHHLGLFNTKEEAARAYDEAAKELHGEFALLNFETEESASNLESQF